MYIGRPLLVLTNRYSFVYQKKKKREVSSNYLFVFFMNSNYLLILIEVVSSFKGSLVDQVLGLLPNSHQFEFPPDHLRITQLLTLSLMG